MSALRISLTFQPTEEEKDEWLLLLIMLPDLWKENIASI
jgi:hypothetical protein